MNLSAPPSEAGVDGLADVRFERLGRDSDLRAFRECARLHVALIHHGALPLLGERFITQLYSTLSTSSGTSVWRAVRADATVGFIAGCADLPKARNSVLLRRGARLVCFGASSLARPSVARKMGAVARYGGRREKPAGGTDAELLAVAVEGDVKRFGIGRRLVESLEADLRSQGVQEYVVSTNRTDPAANAFYIGLGFRTAGQIGHHDLVLQTYSKSL